jgi:hypothetical protein
VKLLKLLPAIIMMIGLQTETELLTTLVSKGTRTQGKKVHGWNVM